MVDTHLVVEDGIPYYDDTKPGTHAPWVDEHGQAWAVPIAEYPAGEAVPTTPLPTKRRTGDGLAVGDEVALTLLSDPTLVIERRVWDGTTWVPSHDEAALAAAQAAVTAQAQADAAGAAAATAKAVADAAQAAANNAQSTANAANNLAATADGRVTVATANPTAANAAGKPIGAIWEVRSGGTTLRRYVLTAASTWTQVKIGQDFIGTNAIGSAQIADAAVGTAQIADASIVDAKIGNLNAGKITAGTLDTARLNAVSVGAAVGEFVEARADKLVAGTGVLSTAVVEKLYAEVVKAKKITADMVAIGSGANEAWDPYADAGPSIWTDPTNGSIAAAAAFPGHPYGHRLVSRSSVVSNMTLYSGLPQKPPSSGAHWVQERGVPVTPGEVIVATSEWYFTAAPGSTSATGAATQVYFYDASGTQVPSGGNQRSGAAVAPASVPVGEWFTVGGGQITVPAGAAYALVRPTFYWPASTAYPTPFEAYIGKMTLLRANAASLIVDGGILARHLAAGSVTATQIKAGSITATNGIIASLDASKITVGLLSSERIGANTITADKIAANAVTAGKIAAKAVTAGTIATNAVTADAIEAGAVTAAALSADAIDGKIITGATIQTVATPNRGVKLTSTGLRAYDDSGNLTAQITGTGGLITGYTITGGLVQTAASGKRAVLGGDGGGWVGLWNHSGIGDEGYNAFVGTAGTISGMFLRNTSGKVMTRLIIDGDNGYLAMYDADGNLRTQLDAPGGNLRFWDTSRERLRITSGGQLRAWAPNGQESLSITTENDNTYGRTWLQGPEYASRRSMMMLGRMTVDGTTSSVAQIYSSLGQDDQAKLLLAGGGSWWLGSGTRGRVSMDNSSGEILVYPRSNLLSFYNLPTTTSTGNPITMIVSGAGRPSIYRNTSVRAAKMHITDVERDLDPATVLDLPVRSWYDRAEWERHVEALEASDLAADHAVPADQDVLLRAERTDPLRRIPGLVAEEVRDAGLDLLCSRDENGELSGVMYDRVALLLIPLVRDLTRRVNELEAAAAA